MERKTGDASHTGAGSLTNTGKIKARDITISNGLDEKTVTDYLGKQTEQLTQEMKAQGHDVTAEISGAVEALVESKFVAFVCDIRAEQFGSEARIKDAIQKKFEELQDGTAALYDNFLEALKEKQAEGNQLLQSLNALQKKAEYCANQHYNALYSRLDDVRQRLDRINDREVRQDRENIFALQKKLEYGHNALQAAEFDRAKKHFEAVAASNVGGSDSALVANAYFGMALAEWQIQLIWDDVKNSEQFILYNYDIDLLDTHGSYREAMANGSENQKSEFQKFVAKLRRAKEKLCAYRDKGLSYDCFICTKVTADNKGTKTDDCKWIEETKLCEVLKESNPFYSKIECPNNFAEEGTLEYESLIYYALSRARVMLLVCSDKQYLETPWVSNEINRFRQFCKKRGDNPLERIIVVHKDKAVELPSDLDERYQGWNRNETDLDTIAKTVKAAVANARGYVEGGWKYCPKCGKQYPSTMAVCNETTKKCKFTPLVDALEWANILRTQSDGKLAERDREIAELKREKSLLGSERNIPPKGDTPLEFKPKPVKFCVSCGAENPGHAKYCIECGGRTFAKTREEMQEEAKRVTPAPAPDLPPDYPTLKNYDKSEFLIEGEALVKYKGEGGDVKIPFGVTSIEDGAVLCNGSTSVVIPDSVTSIGDEVFYCSGLEHIEVAKENPVYRSENNCLIDRRSNSLILGCKNSIIPDSVTSIGDRAFSGCSGLTSVVIPNSVTSIGEEAFSYCSNLTSVVIPDSVTSIGRSAFRNCSGLMSVVIPDSVTSIGEEAFYDCSGLTSVVIPNSVTSVGDRAFLRCSLLEIITIPDRVTSIGDNAFCGCSSLTSVVIPDSVTSIGRSAFADCSSLTSVVIPDSVTSIGDWAFECCINLTSVVIPDSVTSIGDEVFYCSGLTSVVIPDSVTSIGDRAFSGCSGLTSVVIPNSVTSIGDRAFSGCSGLTSVVIPNSVTSIGDNAFSNCNRLTIYCEAKSKPLGWGKLGDASVVWGYTPPSAVMKNESAEPQPAPQSVSVAPKTKQKTEEDSLEPKTKSEPGTDLSSDYPTLKNYDKSEFLIAGKVLAKYKGKSGNAKIPLGVTSIDDGAFYSSGLTSVIIPDSVTSVGINAFLGCSRLEHIEVAKENPVYRSENNCLIDRRSNSLILGCKNSVIPNSVISIGPFVFYGCSNPTSIVIPNGVTSIGEAAFESCDSLQTVIFEGGSQLTSIGRSAFADCSSLTSVVIPDSVTSIGDWAFSGCSGLTSIVIPDSVTSIGYGAFAGCSGLTSVVIPNSVTSIGEAAFIDCNNLTIYCGAKKAAARQWDRNWNPDHCKVVWGLQKSQMQ